MGKRLLQLLCLAISIAFSIGTGDVAQAQSYPTKPIRLVVAAPPGGGTDLIARLVAEHLTTALGQSVVVDNRGGAGGNIAAAIVAEAPNDGYTLLMVAASHAINPSLYKSLTYDPVKDFVPITELAASPYVMVVNNNSPATNLKDFIAYAKSKNGALSYSSAGIGQASHLGMEMLKAMMGFDAAHIPYQGGTSAVADLLAGRIDFSLWSAPTAIPLIKSGEIHALAVTSPKRLDLLPDVPTIAESGYSDFEIGEWKGFLAPAGTPQEVVTRIYEETAKILQMPEMIGRLATSGATPVGSSPQDFSAFIASEMARYAKAVQESGAQVD